MTSQPGLNWSFIGALSLMVIIPWAVWLFGINPRGAGALISAVAVAMLFYQLVGEYPHTPAIGRAAVMLVLLFLIAGGVGSTQIAAGTHIKITYATYPLIGVRVGAVLLAVYYKRLVQVGTNYPLKRDAFKRRRPENP